MPLLLWPRATPATWTLCMSRAKSSRSTASRASAGALPALSRSRPTSFAGSRASARPATTLPALSRSSRLGVGREEGRDVFRWKWGSRAVLLKTVHCAPLPPPQLCALSPRFKDWPVNCRATISYPKEIKDEATGEVREEWVDETDGWTNVIATNVPKLGVDHPITPGKCLRCVRSRNCQRRADHCHFFLV